MVKRLILEFPPKEADRAVDEIYDNAPFEFQRKYRFVRIKIGTTGRGSRHGESVHAMEIGQLIEEAFDEFPPYGFDVPRRYQEVIHILLDRMSRPQPIGTFALLSEVIEEFWGLFCTYLRLDPLGNVLVDRKTIERWEDYAQMKFEIFQRNIGDIIVELCNSAPHLKEEQALAPIYEKRSREQSEEAQTIDEMADVFEDIDSTLAQLYGRPARR
jgi:hypothetical protein